MQQKQDEEEIKGDMQANTIQELKGMCTPEVWRALNEFMEGNLQEARQGERERSEENTRRGRSASRGQNTMFERSSSKQRNLHPRKPKGPSASELEQKEHMRVTKLCHDAKHGYTTAAHAEDGWKIPTNLTLENEISLAVAYREDKVNDNLKLLAARICSAAGLTFGERTYDKYMLYLYLRETFKNMADGLPPMTAAEKKEQDKGDRRQQRKLDRLAEVARRELVDGTYRQKNEDRWRQ